MSLSRSPLEEALGAARALLCMPVSYLSIFEGANVVMYAVSAEPDHEALRPGDVRPADKSFCKLVLDGFLPAVVPDTSHNAYARDLPAVKEQAVGAIVSVPIQDEAGEPFGMFCCLSPDPCPGLDDRDLQTVKMFAAIAAGILTTGDDQPQVAMALRRAVRDVMIDQDHAIHLQPIIDMSTGEVRGYEALSRFNKAPYRAPDMWFADAATVGLQTRLESWVISKAILLLPALPQSSYLSINAAPETVETGIVRDLLAQTQPDRIVLELTEHSDIRKSRALLDELQALRDMGVRVAVDDLGAGYASLSSLLILKPDIIKLDISIVNAIHKDATTQAMARALLQFADEIDATLIAEGVECPMDRDTLTRLGFAYGQGFLFAKPAPPAELGLMSA